MNNRTESQIREELRTFAGIDSAYRISSCPHLIGSYIADYRLNDPTFATELTALDDALLRLQPRIEDHRIQPILSNLFIHLPIQKAIKAWDQALSEIYTLAHFELRGILHSIGWPSEFTGASPFDFSLKVNGTILAGDVKPANGSGYRLLEDALRGCVSDLAVQSATAVPQVTIRYQGPLTQEIVGPNIKRVISDFKAKIRNANVSQPQTFELKVGSTKVVVILGGTAPRGGGIAGTSLLSNALALTLKSHIKGKGSQGSKYDICFILAYVRLPGRGSADLKTHVTFGDAVTKAVTALEHPTPHWLGNIILYPGGECIEQPRFFANPKGVFPPLVSAASVSEAIGATMIRLPHFRGDIGG